MHSSQAPGTQPLWLQWFAGALLGVMFVYLVHIARAWGRTV